MTKEAHQAQQKAAEQQQTKLTVQQYQDVLLSQGDINIINLIMGLYKSGQELDQEALNKLQASNVLPATVYILMV